MPFLPVHPNLLIHIRREAIDRNNGKTSSHTEIRDNGCEAYINRWLGCHVMSGGRWVQRWFIFHHFLIKSLTFCHIQSSAAERPLTFVLLSIQPSVWETKCLFIYCLNCIWRRFGFHHGLRYSCCSLFRRSHLMLFCVCVWVSCWQNVYVYMLCVCVL